MKFLYVNCSLYFDISDDVKTRHDALERLMRHLPDDIQISVSRYEIREDDA